MSWLLLPVFLSKDRSVLTNLEKSRSMTGVIGRSVSGEDADVLGDQAVSVDPRLNR